VAKTLFGVDSTTKGAKNAKEKLQSNLLYAKACTYFSCFFVVFAVEKYFYGTAIEIRKLNAVTVTKPDKYLQIPFCKTLHWKVARYSQNQYN
jgi:hypothetical protein